MESNFSDFVEGINSIDFSNLVKDNNITIYKKNDDIYDIINNILENNFSEESFFIVDIGKIIRQYLKWKEHLPDIEAFYAVKCNPTPIIIEVLAGLGCSFDTASKGEIASVLNYIDDPSKIIFANPCKMSNQIKYARAMDVDLTTFDSDHELYKMKLYHPNCNLILRIKVNDSKSICKFSCKFGATLEEGEKLLEIAKTLKLNIVGVSFHIGSGCQDSMQYDEAIKDSRKLFDIAKSKYDFDFNILNIGGGFTDNNFESMAEVINKSITENFKDLTDNIKIIAEPGRFLSANSHTLVINVIGKKENIINGEKHFTYTINNSIYSAFNCIMFDHAKPEILPFNERTEEVKYESRIVGNTCDGLDVITESIKLPELVIGEWLYVEDFGAYTVAASTDFNGFTKTENTYILSC
jgi:ornithine decarboxylase